MQVVQNFIKEINIQIINICNMKCSFCPRANITPEELRQIESTGVMSQTNFEKIVLKCIEGGVSKFCLTPRMGEVLMDRGFLQKLAFLESLPEVTDYFFATNLTLESSPLINYVNQSQKCTFEVSYYGEQETFLKLTNGKAIHFQTFKENLSRIAAKLENKKKMTLFQRFIGQNIFPIVKMLRTQGVIYNIDETKNYNIGGLLKNNVEEYQSISRRGACPTKQTGSILINGAYNLCYMNDVFNSLTQGNIFETDLITLRKNAVLDGHEICRICNESW